MTDRERLVEILKTEIHPRVGADPADVVADFLLDNGVIVPPCNVGDVVFWITTDNKIRRNKVFSIKAESEDDHYTYFVKCKIFNQVRMFYTFVIGRDCFITKEEAEKALKERENG